MENIQQPLELLILTSVIVLIVVSIFLVKLLIDLTNLVKSLQELTGIVKKELEPTIIELQKALANVNSITSNADQQVNNLNSTLNKSIDALSDSTNFLYTKAKIITSSLLDGIITGIKVFKGK